MATVTIYIDDETNFDGSNVIEIVTSEGSYLTEPSVPPRPYWVESSYEFDGWRYISIENSDWIKWNFNTTVIDKLLHDGVTLFASWVPTRTVVFDAQNGSDALTVQVLDGHLLPEPAPPTRPGYRFLGWLEQFNLSNYRVESSTREQDPGQGWEYYMESGFAITGPSPSAITSDKYEVVVQHLRGQLYKGYYIAQPYEVTVENVYTIEDVLTLIVRPENIDTSNVTYGHLCPYEIFIREKTNHDNISSISGANLAEFNS
jgi:hypothetical protein